MVNKFYEIFEKTENHADCVEPKYSSESAFCVDLYVGKNNDKKIIEPMKWTKVGLGIKIRVDYQNKNCGFALFIRSGLASKFGLSLMNGIGVIDSDYKDEILACVINFSEEPYILTQGAKFCQIALMPRLVFRDLVCCDTRNGGFGSTGS